MTTKAQEILNQALQLGPDERAELASQLLSSLEDDESYADLHPGPPRRPRWRPVFGVARSAAGRRVRAHPRPVRLAPVRFTPW